MLWSPLTMVAFISLSKNLFQEICRCHPLLRKLFLRQFLLQRTAYRIWSLFCTVWQIIGNRIPDHQGFWFIHIKTMRQSEFFLISVTLPCPTVSKRNNIPIYQMYIGHIQNIRKKNHWKKYYSGQNQKADIIKLSKTACPLYLDSDGCNLKSFLNG